LVVCGYTYKLCVPLTVAAAAEPLNTELGKKRETGGNGRKGGIEAFLSDFRYDKTR